MYYDERLKFQVRVNCCKQLVKLKYIVKYKVVKNTSMFYYHYRLFCHFHAHKKTSHEHPGVSAWTAGVRRGLFKLKILELSICS